MKKKHLIIILAIISAVCLTVSAAVYWYLNITSISKLLADDKDLTDEETLILKDTGYPDWKTYIITYFLMLSTLIACISVWIAVFHPDMRGSSVATVMEIVSLGLLVIIFKGIKTARASFCTTKS